MPAELPGVVWPAAWPIEIPEIQPTFIPTGAPVPNPNYNPSAPPSTENQPFVQPGINVQPAPTPSAPWQVDVQPVNRPTANPNPGSDPIPNTNPDGTPKPDPGDKPRDKDDRDICDKHPDVVACQKMELDTPEGEIPKASKAVTYSIENSWGGGSCPADVYATLGGKTVKIYDWHESCDYIATYVRPMLLILCAIGALFIVMPGKADS